MKLIGRRRSDSAAGHGHASALGAQGARTQSVDAPARLPSLLNARWLRRLAAAAGAIQLALQLAVAIPVAWDNRETNRDVHQLYTHATMVRNGERLYWPWPEYGPNVMTLNGPGYTQRRQPYPPFLTPALSHLAVLPYVQFERIWSVLLLLSFWVYAACLARVAVGRFDPAWVLGAGAVLAITPGAYYAFGIGNVDPVLWACLGLALVFPTLRGLGFAASALVKLYGAWPLLFALEREGRRVLFGGAVAVATATAISVVSLGFGGFIGAFRDWFRYMLPVVGQGTFNVGNLSASMGVLRLLRFAGWAYTAGPLPGWAHAWLVGIGILAPLTTGYLLRRRSVALQTAGVVCAATVFGPIFWPTYVPLLVAPVAVLIGERGLAWAR